ncbi:MAG: YgjV family protein [Lachnospiraceae bacterium]|nr:YgjV family protein [Lachnospiraceae bacterium]
MEFLQETLTSTVAIANGLSLIGCILMVLSGSVKGERNTLRIQNLQLVILGIANFMLTGYTGAAINAIGIARNLLYRAKKLTMPVKIALIAVAALATYLLNNAGIVGWFPTLTMVLFTFLLGFGGVIGIKVITIVAQILWAFYDFHYRNYTAFAFDLITVCSCIVGIYRNYRLYGKKAFQTE